MITLDFAEWNDFRADLDEAALARFYQRVGRTAVTIFTQSSRGPHSGSVVRLRNGSSFRRSTSSEYPARESGRLLHSLRFESNAHGVVVGTNTHYSAYLRSDTRYMARRKMSDNALEESIQINLNLLQGTVEWQRGRS